MKKLIAIVLILILALSSMPSFAAENTSIDVYVDAAAADGGNGSFDLPFNTLEQARDYIRQLKMKGSYPQNGITVNIKGGMYSRNTAFKLDEQDSGEEGAPVVYRAYGNDEVKIVGGAEIHLSDMRISEDSAIDASVKGKIYSYNLKANGIKGYDDLSVTGHSAWYLQEMGFSKVGLNVPVVLFNNSPCTLARYPNGEEWMKIEKVIDPGDAVRHWYEKDKSADYVPEEERHYPPRVMSFTVSESRIEKWAKAKNPWMHGYWFYDWSDQTTPIESIDVGTKTITTGYPSAYGAREEQRFYVYNLLEELDVPGEWYYDTQSGEFYIYPTDNNADSTIILPFAEDSLLTINGAKNIEIRGIDFTGSRTSAVVMGSCENVKINYCTVSHVAANGITATNAKKVTVEGCHVYDVGSIGITVEGGDYQTLEPAGNLIKNNWIHDFGVIVKTYTPGIKMHGVGNTTSYNLIHGGPHAGMTYGGNDNIIEYNEIYDVMNEAGDMAALYCGRSLVARGNIIRGNIIHDIYTDSDASSIHAVYFDDSYSGQTVTGNIFYNIQEEAVFVNGGRDNTITNNIFVNCLSGLKLICGGRAKNWNLDLDFEHRLGLTRFPYQSEAYSKYPHLANIMEDVPLDSKYNVFKNNVDYNVEKKYAVNNLTQYGSPVTYDELMGMNDIHEGYIATDDSIFVSPESGNYTLKSDCDVFAEMPEFQNIDARKAGLITSRLKKELSEDAVALSIGNPSTYVNWERQFIDSENLNVVPFIENDRTFVPVRFLAEMLGGSVGWDNGKATIEYNGQTMVLESGSNVVMVNDNAIEMENKTIIRQDRMFVPLRECTQLFGKEVFWDPSGLIIVSGTKMDERFDVEMIADLVNRM